MSSWAERAPGWERLLPKLQQALDYTEGLVLASDVRALIERDDCQWWPLGDSVAVTELVSYPQGKVCRIWLGAGELDELLQVERLIAAWARQQGCLGIEICGRDGWARALPGYRRTASVIVRRFDQESEHE